MKKYFCIADAHSFYNEMMRALNEAGYDKNNPDHIFVSCGDLFDRGPQSREMLEFVNSIPSERKILIMGNHEILMRQMIWGGMYPRMIDKMNGTWQTARDITGADSAEVLEKMRKNDDWFKYYNECKYYSEIGDFIITHGWLPCVHKPGGKVILDSHWREYDCYSEEWEKATWLNGMKCWYDDARPEGKTVICGHWNTSWGHSVIRHACVYQYDHDAIHEPFIDDGIVALDACTVVSHKVNCFVFEI